MREGKENREVAADFRMLKSVSAFIIAMYSFDAPDFVRWMTVYCFEHGLDRKAALHAFETGSKGDKYYPDGLRLAEQKAAALQYLGIREDELPE
jgi:hypothetical protein